MSDATESKPFSYVRHLREIRDEIGREIEGMTYEELRNWLNSQEYADPTLRRWAEKCRRAEAARTSTSR